MLVQSGCPARWACAAVASASMRKRPTDARGRIVTNRSLRSGMILSSVRVLILGASGGVGRWLTRLAADRGHEVTALVRASSGFVAPPGVDVRVGEVLDGAALDNAVQGQEVVASCLGIRRAGLNPWAPILSPSDFVTRATQLLVPIMHRHQVRRLIALSAGGVADSFKQCTAPIKRLTKLGTVGVQYRDLTGMEAVLA